MPFSLNPFARKKNIDFTQGIPQAPKELPDRKPYDDEKHLLNSIFADTPKKNEHAVESSKDLEESRPDGPGTGTL